jgi:hypothetical protein
VAGIVDFIEEAERVVSYRLWMRSLCSKAKSRKGLIIATFFKSTWDLARQSSVAMVLHVYLADMTWIAYLIGLDVG